MSHCDQRVHGTPGRLTVIGADTGQVGKAQRGRVDGDQNAGNVNLSEIPKEIPAVAAQEENAQGLFFLAQLHCPQNLIAVLVHVVHIQRVLGLGHMGLDGFQHFGKHLIGAALYDHKDGRGMGLQLLGIGIDLETAFLHFLQDDAAGFFADIRLIVQYSGDRSHTVPGHFGQIFNRHGLPPFPGITGDISP